MFVDKGHFLLQGLDLRKMVNLEIGPKSLQGLIDGHILVGVDEVIGDCLAIGQAHLGNVFQEKEVLLLRLRIFTSHDRYVIIRK